MLAAGVDIVAIPRITRALEHFGARFTRRICTEAEIAHIRGRPAELAARFAAKEATAKALGTGMRLLSPIGVGWHEVEVLNEISGQPYLRLHGHAARVAEARGLIEWAVSLSHDGDIAIAFVVATQ